MKSSANGFLDRLDTSEQRLCKLKNRPKETLQNASRTKEKKSQMNSQETEKIEKEGEGPERGEEGRNRGSI